MKNDIDSAKAVLVVITSKPNVDGPNSSFDSELYKSEIRNDRGRQGIELGTSRCVC